ncbi:hypothetical protein [Clostridium saccharoperbutylacetonicum]
MKSNKVVRIIHALILFISFFLIYYIGFEIIGLKHNIINYIILGIISGCLVQLFTKIFKKENK